MRQCVFAGVDLIGDGAHYAPKVLISDALSLAAVAIFKDRGVEVDFQPKLGADKEKLAAIDRRPSKAWPSVLPPR